MPPRKKAKASAASTPLAEAQPRTPQDSGPTAQSLEQGSPSQDQNILNDPWTDDQETQLFKSMIKWKPTGADLWPQLAHRSNIHIGLHKHFRMLSIHNNMRSHGYVTDETPHTRIPGLWDRLQSLYDLRALDERENAYAFHDTPDPHDAAEAYNLSEFTLPEEDFGELLWQKRFHGPESAVSSSPPLMPTEDEKALYTPGFGLLQDLPNGPSSQRAESASGTTPTPKGKATRSGRAAAKATRAAKAGQNAKNSKTESVASDSAEDEDEDDDEDDDSDESEEEAAPSTRRSNRSAKTRAAPKRTRKR